MASDLVCEKLQAPAARAALRWVKRRDLLPPGGSAAAVTPAPARGRGADALPRPLQEGLLLEQLQVEAHPDLPGGDLVQKESPGGGAFAFLLRADFRHWNFSPTQEIWGVNARVRSLPGSSRGRHSPGAGSARGFGQLSNPQQATPSPAVRLSGRWRGWMQGGTLPARALV